MAKLIAQKGNDFTISLTRLELAIYLENMAQVLDKELNNEQGTDLNVSLILAGVEPFIEFAKPETREYFEEVMENLLEDDESEEQETQENEFDFEE